VCGVAAAKIVGRIIGIRGAAAAKTLGTCGNLAAEISDCCGILTATIVEACGKRRWPTSNEC